MRFNFDRTVKRWQSNSVKWDLYPNFQKVKPPNKIKNKKDILPMWVADMDFQIPPPVIEALKKRADHGIFGYTDRTETYDQNVVNWMKKRYNWDILPEMICPVIGVVPALHLIVREFTKPGDKIIIQPPVYPPFFQAVTSSKRNLISNPLVLIDGKYSMNLTQLEEQVKDPEVKMIILCSPHNPVGRVWTEEELLQFGKICLDNDVLVVSDEIHADIILNGHRFVPFALLDTNFANQSITCTAPSKTFNIASLMVANMIISNSNYRNRFKRIASDNGLFGINAFGLVACESAYRDGEEWLSEVLQYIDANFNFVYNYLAKNIPVIQAIRAQGTYLVWLDFRKLPIEPSKLDQFIFDKAKLFLNPGTYFGTEGKGFMRMNLACPRSIVEKAMNRLKRAIDGLQ